jgi:hypothetical protein
MRGAPAPVGTERIAANGYHYVKTSNRGWVLKHWLVWEETSGRKINPAFDTVRFKDGDKHNFEPGNIEVLPKGTSTPRKRLAQIEARIQELTAEKVRLEKYLATRAH